MMSPDLRHDPADAAQIFVPRRRKQVLKRVREDGGASIQVLAASLGVSESTVRRDLNVLAKQGHLERIHGGAVLPREQAATYEPHIEVSSRIAIDQKRAIGKFAAGLIEHGTSVIFDSGSTVLQAAISVAEHGTSLTAITNDLAIAQVFANAPNAKVIVTGGFLRPRSNTLYGGNGLSFLQEMHADMLFLGTHALTDGVLTESSLEIANTKRAMIAGSRRTIVLADHTKFAAPAFAEICRVRDVDGIITDDLTASDVLNALRQTGISVMVAR